MEISEAIRLVRSFHAQAGHPAADVVVPLSNPRRRVRAGWLEEEVKEFLDARDITDQVDALVDLLYFLLGCAVEMGLADLSREFEIVHRANAAKVAVSVERVERGGDGKVEKPFGWVDPRPEVAAAVAYAASGRRLVRAGPFQCVAACLAMVAGGLGTEAGLGDLLDLLPPARIDGDPRDQGVRLTEGLIESVLAELGIAVSVERVPASHLSDLNALTELERLLERGEVLVGVDISRLELGREEYGHLLVVESVVGDCVRVLDPGPATEGIRLFHIDDLYPAVVARPDGGYWLIEPVGA